MRRNFFIPVILAFLCTLPGRAQEEINPLKEDRFLVEAGVFWVSRNFKVGADGQTPNQEIDFNESFGVSASDGAVLKEGIVFEDIVFEQGSFVEGCEFWFVSPVL